MKLGASPLAVHNLLLSADEHRCAPAEAHVFAGGSVRIAVSSGPPQSFEISSAAGGGADETPRIPAGEHYDWWVLAGEGGWERPLPAPNIDGRAGGAPAPVVSLAIPAALPCAAAQLRQANARRVCCRRKPAVPGPHTIASQVYPGCKATVHVRAAQAAQPVASGGGGSASAMSGAVDATIRFPLGRQSRASQTDPVPSASRFASTSTATAGDGHLPPLHSFRPGAACTPASVLPGITTAAAAAVAGGSLTGSLFASPEEQEVLGAGTGLRRRSTQRPGSAGSLGSASAAPLLGPAARTPDAGGGLGSGRSTPGGSEGLSSGSSSQVGLWGSPALWLEGQRDRDGGTKSRRRLTSLPTVAGRLRCRPTPSR